MKEQVAIACIFYDCLLYYGYQPYYEATDVRPSYHLWLATLQSPNPFYRADLEKRTAEQGIININIGSSWDGMSELLDPDYEPMLDMKVSHICAGLLKSESGNEWVHNVDAGVIELHIWQLLESLRNPGCEIIARSTFNVNP